MTTLKTNECQEGQSSSGSRFVGVPLCHQETLYTCGVACVQSILKCYGMDYRQDELARILHSKPVLGTDYRAIIRFVEQLGFQASFHENMSIDWVKRLIDDGITPLLLIQAWPDDCVDFASDWKDNHYVIACGYTGDWLYFMDPFTLGNYTYLRDSELPERWHVIDKSGRRYYNSGLVIRNDHSPFVYDPHAVKHLG